VKRISYLANKDYNAPSFRPALRASRDASDEMRGGGSAIAAEVLLILRASHRLPRIIRILFDPVQWPL